MIWRYAETADKLLRNNGMVQNKNGKQLQRQLESVALECKPWVMPFLKGKPPTLRSASLIYIFHYDKAAQGVYYDADGLSFIFPDNTAAIGIADDVLLHRDRDYQTLCFLHELAHLAHPNHSPDFVQHLDCMIFEFNEATGRNIANDLSHEGLYVDLTGHYTIHADSAAACIVA